MLLHNFEYLDQQKSLQKLDKLQHTNYYFIKQIMGVKMNIESHIFLIAYQNKFLKDKKLCIFLGFMRYNKNLELLDNLQHI